MALSMFVTTLWGRGDTPLSGADTGFQKEGGVRVTVKY